MCVPVTINRIIGKLIFETFKSSFTMFLKENFLNIVILVMKTYSEYKTICIGDGKLRDVSGVSVKKISYYIYKHDWQKCLLLRLL